MPWVYEVRNKKFYLNGTFKFEARYAGAKGYYDNPEFQCVKNKGVLPRGKYIIGAPYNSTRTGLYTLSLTPDKSNHMCGRDAFKIHGESRKHPSMASEGCIILDRKPREDIWNSGDRELIIK